MYNKLDRHSFCESLTHISVRSYLQARRREDAFSQDAGEAKEKTAF